MGRTQYALYRLFIMTAMVALLFGVTPLRGYFNIICVAVAALALSALVLTISRRDWASVGRIMLWTGAGAVIGNLTSANFPPEYVLPGAIAGSILGLLTSWKRIATPDAPDEDAERDEK
jgi:hypothetical protein